MALLTLAPEVLVFLQLVSDAQQDPIEDAPALPGLYHLDVEPAKNLWMLL
jgi:hypothetical protein